VAKCTESDLKALEEAGPLLRFAAEHVKDLDLNLAVSIAKAQEAADAEQWTPEIKGQFWAAFNKLCDLIQPVTMDSLETAHDTVEPSRLRRFFGAGKETIAEQSSRRFLFVLYLLLALILPIQLYVWTCSSLSKKIDDLFATEKDKFAQLAQDFSKLDAETRNLDPSKWSQDQIARADKISAIASSFDDDIYRILIEVRLLQSVATLFTGTLTVIPFVKFDTTLQWYQQFDAAANLRKQIELIQIATLKIQETVNLIVGIAGAYVLPILFGMIGAVAYVIRTLSDQIRASTFALSTPVRHVMRVALGAMMGLIVVALFGDLSSKLSLSPLAVAFLAGYGVEAVFSMFDAVIEKFKDSRSAV
jgi:hypothetical protein